MQKAFFLISATTGCVNDLQSVLELHDRVREVWRVVSGECQIIALVASEELGDSTKELGQLMDLKESLGELSDERFDEESEGLSKKNFVDKVSINLIFPESGPRFAVSIDSPGAFPPREEAR